MSTKQHVKSTKYSGSQPRTVTISSKLFESFKSDRHTLSHQLIPSCNRIFVQEYGKHFQIQATKSRRCAQANATLFILSTDPHRKHHRISDSQTEKLVQSRVNFEL